MHNFSNINNKELRSAVVKMELSDYILECHSCTAGSGSELVVREQSRYTLLPTPWESVVWRDH
jgi:hypothetical protein